MNAHNEMYTQKSATKLAHLIVFYLQVLKGNQTIIKATPAIIKTAKKAKTHRELVWTTGVPLIQYTTQ